MTRYLLFALILTACSCASEHVAPDAQIQLATIASAYGAARAVELDHCPGSPNCEDIRKLGYNAESAYVVANTERTRTKISDARKSVLAYSNAAKGLQ